MNYCSLRTECQTQVKCLVQTGAGIDPSEAGGEQQLRYKVPVTGPDLLTPDDAWNLWGMF